MRSVLDGRTPFPAVEEPGGAYHNELRKIRGRAVSGVYAILNDGEVLYVGESHTGRLYDTITRHFRRWRPEHDPQGRRRGGTTYDRERVYVVYAITTPGEAPDYQYHEIQRLAPRDNDLDGGSVCCEGDPAPF